MELEATGLETDSSAGSKRRCLLTFGATIVGLVIALPLGIIAGVKPYSKFGHIATGRFRCSASRCPDSGSGLLLLLFFSVGCIGCRHRAISPSGKTRWKSIKHLILPAVTLGVGLAAPLARFVRSGMIDVMGSDYIRTARAKGLAERAIIPGTRCGTACCQW